jgi:ABC-type transporter Mla maintaining outer membrane lipid asymmetry ATPase subunit MlaF
VSNIAMTFQRAVLFDPLYIEENVALVPVQHS